MRAHVCHCCLQGTVHHVWGSTSPPSLTYPPCPGELCAPVASPGHRLWAASSPSPTLPAPTQLQLPAPSISAASLSAAQNEQDAGEAKQVPPPQGSCSPSAQEGDSKAQLGGQGGEGTIHWWVPVGQMKASGGPHLDHAVFCLLLL